MPAKLIQIIIDSCRPDALAQAHTPNLDSIWQNGAYSWQGQSVSPSISLPAHTSMFRSIPPQVHGVFENTFVPDAAYYPSIIEVAFKDARHTAMFYNWEPLRDLSAPDHLYMNWCRIQRPGEDNDSHTMRAAIDYLSLEQPDYIVIYLGDLDVFGHLYGWMSPEYLHVLESNDLLIGHLLSALVESGLNEAYTIMVLSDHGGIRQGHGGDTPEEMTIIWMLNGPGIRHNYEITSPFSLLDVAPTIAYLLQVPQSDLWQGQPIVEAFMT
jgi:predicted AlkP superfamily pyrophosphatase or phosphodiesterase